MHDQRIACLMSYKLTYCLYLDVMFLSSNFKAPLYIDKHVWERQSVLFNSLDTPLGISCSAV